MSAIPRTIVALSGGVDSAVAAWLLREQGHAVECLHMTNWDDDDGYCQAATDLQDARAVCKQLGLPLHRVNFAREYREAVFAEFLAETRAGYTPNPDVACNREIKFGVLRAYARRLGADYLATGHYARLGTERTEAVLLRARDAEKDQSYFLSAVDAGGFSAVLFPLGELAKGEVRAFAAAAGLSVAGKRDSTGICFIGERPFAEFLETFVPPAPGSIVTETGAVIGHHEGLHRYTLGQRKGIGVGGLQTHGEAPWFVAAKNRTSNELVVVQGHDHPLLFCTWCTAGPAHWIGPAPMDPCTSAVLRCQVKTRYRQADQACTLVPLDGGMLRIEFDQPQRAVTPGQFAVFYLGERCLGSARIAATGRHTDDFAIAAEAG